MPIPKLGVFIILFCPAIDLDLDVAALFGLLNFFGALFFLFVGTASPISIPLV